MNYMHASTYMHLHSDLYYCRDLISFLATINREQFLQLYLHLLTEFLQFEVEW